MQQYRAYIGFFSFVIYYLSTYTIEILSEEYMAAEFLKNQRRILQKKLKASGFSYRNFMTRRLSLC